MSTNWLITIKPSFTAEWLALPKSEIPHILDKINLLMEDPTPDAKAKKQLKHLHPRLHRIRCGNYRIFYTFEDPYISLLSVQRRKEDTYDGDFDIEFLGGINPEIQIEKQTSAPRDQWEQFLAPKLPEPQGLPEPITPELLIRLKIPQEYHAQLLRISTEEELLDCPNVPQELLARLVDALFPRPLAQVMQQPDFLVPNGSDDLLRIKEGELIPFLLKLSPDQEKYVTWAMQATGPTLLKGGPGTGKSTIALYRVHALLQELRKNGQKNISILFTTYTNALVKSSQQLLEQLLGEDMHHVEVQTADKLTMRLLGETGQHHQMLESWKVNELLKQAISETQFDGASEQQHTQQLAIARMSLDYLAQEINQVIVARQIDTLKDYLAAARAGRRVRLGGMQRRAVWSVTATFRQLLRQQREITWSQARALLHTDLRFQGRSALLQTNYRSTQEIGEAAQSYLAGGALDTEPVERKYVNNGPQPALRRVPNSGEQTRLLVNFFQQTRSHFHLSLGVCAVLCPTTQAGRAVAADLTSRGIPATFMTGQELDLKRPGVKVLTLQSAKGLEFPIVALAGFLESSWHTSLPTSITGEEREEMLALERRAMFVGMTRAMRALLIVIPERARSPLLSGFAEQYWNLGE